VDIVQRLPSFHKNNKPTARVQPWIPSNDFVYSGQIIGTVNTWSGDRDEDWLVEPEFLYAETFGELRWHTLDLDLESLDPYATIDTSIAPPEEVSKSTLDLWIEFAEANKSLIEQNLYLPESYLPLKKSYVLWQIGLVYSALHKNANNYNEFEEWTGALAGCVAKFLPILKEKHEPILSKLLKLEIDSISETLSTDMSKLKGKNVSFEFAFTDDKYYSDIFERTLLGFCKKFNFPTQKMLRINTALLAPAIEK
jgi:hypothetical protein